MNYHFKVHKNSRGGYWAKCVELNGCQTEGDDLEELRRNMREALDLYLSEPQDSKMIFPFPKSMRGKSVVEVEVSPRVAFAALLRRERLRHHLTQNQVAAKMGYKSVYAYQKLEASKANPGIDTIEKIKTVLPDFPAHMIFR